MFTVIYKLTRPHCFLSCIRRCSHCHLSENGHYFFTVFILFFSILTLLPFFLNLNISIHQFFKSY
ncbi:hypothetical protein Lalb_Chr09g0324181 [Lupinus albus]|uniref:Uncharacterized protein n=1 Tax=Lupinus albus TaxID=3870 RepID=A0A6A4Q034_LUPAL|nr:hypothetical protein Lalb_Chr09g0324181 [Lupinus albus]